MSNKLEAIRNLKAKLLEMQRDLNRLADNELSVSPEIKLFNQTTKVPRHYLAPQSPSKYSTVKSPERQRAQFKNPTFWGGNPILGKQNEQLSPKKWKNKSPSRKIQTHLPKKLQKVSAQIDRYYYEDKREERKAIQQKKMNQTLPAKVSQRFEFSFHGLQRDTPRFEKIRTYEQPDANPILNPEPSRELGKRIVNPIVTSPKNALTENPHSNPSIYFFRNKKVSLSPKGRSHNKKNLSPNITQIFSSSVQERLMSPPRKQSRKHFQRYFKETFDSNWR